MNTHDTDASSAQNAGAHATANTPNNSDTPTDATATGRQSPLTGAAPERAEPEEARGATDTGDDTLGTLTTGGTGGTAGSSGATEGAFEGAGYRYGDPDTLREDDPSKA